MPRFQTCAVDDPVAARLLAEYVAFRTAGFPGPGAYRAAVPDPTVYRPPSGVFVALIDDDGSAVGCGGIRMLAADVAEIKHLWIQPRQQGRGLGRALLAELERRAAEFGAARAVLDTHRSLTAAGALYAASGYTPVEPYNDNPNATAWFGKEL